MGTGRQFDSRLSSFDRILLLVLVVLGALAGFAVFEIGYLAMFILPLTGIILGITGVGVARDRPYLVAFSAVTALNLWWITKAAFTGLLTEPDGLIGVLQLFALGWVLPLAFAFCAVEGGIRD